MREKEGSKSIERKSLKKRENGIKREIEKPERRENEREEQKCEGWERYERKRGCKNEIRKKEWV